jgi:hypothetical protein
MKRQFKRPGEIRDLILEESRRHGGVGRDSKFGSVVYRTPDETGCNWVPTLLPGGDPDAWMTIMWPFVEDLRSRFNIYD